MALALVAALTVSALPSVGGGVALAASVSVPPSIDGSGSSDVSSKLQAFLNGVPNGSTILFKAGANYRIGRALVINARRSLTIDGNGAQLSLTGTSGGYDSVGILVERSVGTRIRDLTLVGSNSDAGTRRACCSRESQHGIAVFSSKRTLIKHVRISRVWGDCVYVNAGAGGIWSNGVTFRNSTCRLTGRHGVGIIAGNHIRVERVHFDQIGFMVVDIEPGASNEGANHVMIRHNRVGTYGLTGRWVAWLLEAGGASGSVVRHVTVTGNVIQGNRDGYSGAPLGVNVRVLGERGPRQDFTVTNNIGRTPVPGPVLYFSGVRGVTVTGNRQPVSSGGLAAFPGSTDVTYLR
jgi:hypothetical protein